MNRPPAFQFYVNEYRASRSVQRMTYAQRGMYLEMLCEQWDKLSLPDCPRACAEAMGGTYEEWEANWPILRRKFVDRRHRQRGSREDEIPADHDASRQIINLRLERYRRSLRTLTKERQEAGKKGGRAKAQKQKENVAGKATANSSNALANPSSDLQLRLQTATLSSPATQAVPAREPATDARSKRPVYKGQRFVVFEWMLDDLSKLLGRHFESFDLHGWFDELDRRAVAQDELVPQRDGGSWLQAKTLAEATRRGLVLDRGMAVGKTAGNMAAAARFVARGQR